MNKILVFLAVILGRLLGYQLNNNMLTVWQKMLIACFMLSLFIVFAFLNDYLDKLSDELWKAEIAKKCFQESGDEKR